MRVPWYRSSQIYVCMKQLVLSTTEPPSVSPLPIALLYPVQSIQDTLETHWPDRGHSVSCDQRGVLEYLDEYGHRDFRTSMP